MEVILRPLNRNSWSGVVKYKGCFDSIGSYYTRTGRRYTGLSKPDEIKYSEALGLNLSPESEFWDAFSIRMNEKDLILNLDDDFDMLKFLFLKGHKRVAQSLSDVSPSANYVIIDKESEAKESNKFNRIKRQAIEGYGKMSPEDMRKCLRIYGTKADSANMELVESKLFDLVEKDPQRFLDKWINNKTKATEFLIQEALSKNVLRKNKSMYLFGTDTIGHSLEDTIAYLDDPKNNDLKISILKETERK